MNISFLMFPWEEENYCRKPERNMIYSFYSTWLSTNHGACTVPDNSGYCFCCLVAKSCLTLWDPMDCSTPGFPILHYLLEFAQTHVHWVDNVIQPTHPLLSVSPPAFIFPSINIFSKESILHISWPKYWSFSISPSNEYFELICFSIDWLDLLAVQVTLKSLLQHHSSKASVLQCSTFFKVQLSHPYVSTEKKHSFDYTDICQQSDISVF